MENTSTLKQNNKASDEAIKGVLYFLEQELAKRIEQVPTDFSVIDADDPNSWTKQVNPGVQTPLEIMLGVSAKIEVPIKELIHGMILRFFKNNADIVDSVYQNKETEQEHHYFIILKRDTDANRIIFFDFISHLSSMEITQKYPVYFQFVPLQFKSTIMHLEPISI